MVKNKFRLQTIVFDRKIFINKRFIKRWLIRKNLATQKTVDRISSFKGEYRFQFKNAGMFKKNTLHRVKCFNGIYKVIGVLK